MIIVDVVIIISSYLVEQSERSAVSESRNKTGQ